MKPRRSRALGVAARLLLPAALGLAALAAALPRPHAAEAAPALDACPRMTERAEAYAGRVAFVVLDLTDGNRCGHAPHEVFRSASLYKLVVLAEAWAQAEAGAFSFGETLPDWTIDADEMIRLMIRQSDNETADALHERLGFDAVAARAARSGMDDTSLATYETTADDVAEFFARLHARRLVSPEADAAMLETLLGQERVDRIPAALPPGTRIAHKTGRLEQISHDAGIVYAPAGPFVLALLTEDPVAQWNGNALIRDLAAVAWESYAEPRPLPATALPADPLVHEAAYPRPAALASAAADPPPATAFAAVANASSAVAPPEGAEALPAAASGAADEAAPPPSEAPALVVAVTAADVPAPIAAPAPAAAASSNAARANAALPGAAAADAGGGAGAGSVGGEARTLGDGGAAAPWRQPAGLAALAAALALAALALLTRRRGPLPSPAGPGPDADPASGNVDTGSNARWRTSLRGARSNVMMRFGSRGNDPGPETPARAEEEEAPPMEAEDMPDETAPEEIADAPTSPRLERLADFFSAEEGLVEEMGRQVSSEMEPLRQLLGRQRRAIERVMENLDQQLVPIREYVASEESNIEALSGRLGDGEGDYVPRLFADYMDQQRQRIADARQRVDDQRAPFERLAADEREAVELALSYFDEDIEALEHTLNEQRRIIARLLSAMRSDEFGGVRQLIDAREQVLAEAARQGLTDPARIAGQMRELREALDAAGNDHLGRVVDGVAETDDRLLRAGAGPGGVHAVPVPDDEAAPPEIEGSEIEGQRSSA